MNKIISILIISSIFLLGCTSETKTNEIEISAAADDGGVVKIGRSDINAGWVKGNSEDIIVGIVDSGGLDLIWRGMYRFNLEEWNGGDIIIKIKCTNVNGNPGVLEAYLIDDFGPIVDVTSQDPVDISNTWTITNSGEKLDEIEPVVGEWFEITLTKDVIESKISDANYIAIALRLADESIIGGNLYLLNSYEYGVSRGQLKPYFVNVESK